MIQKIFLLLILCCLSKQSHKNNKFLLKLTPEQVMKTFDDVMSDDYIKVLAKEFAAKAAAHFMNEINKQRQSLVEKLSKQYNSSSDESGEIDAKTKQDVSDIVEAANDAVTETVKSELDEDEALRLMQAPAPDGDHLDISGEISQEEHKKIPVIQVTKINGIYYRRLLGMI